MRRATLLLAVVLLVVGCALAFAPFARSASAFAGSEAGVLRLSTRCSPPIVSAWTRDHDGGWFGYAPLTKPPAAFTGPVCRPAARARLAVATWLWLGAALVVVLRRPRPAAPRLAPA